MFLRLTLAALACFFTACGTQQIGRQAAQKSDPAAVALLHTSQKTYGDRAFRQARRIEVHYEGKWAAVGPKFQPILADTKFRGGSDEILDLKKRSITQRHTGVSGEKTVARTPDDIRVAYDGVPSSDPEILRAAALVADAYTMFLTGPFYFDRAGIVLLPTTSTTIDGSLCDQILAILKPGFGKAKEDRVVLSIDRATHQLRRVLMTLNGLDSTIGAEVDVTFRNFQTIDGILWPTDFDERIRAPFRLHAHHWSITKLRVK